jgi:hypothetical protein
MKRAVADAPKPTKKARKKRPKLRYGLMNIGERKRKP